MRWTTVIALLPLASCLHAAEPVVLFNGKDLEGWTSDIIDPKVQQSAVWSVADGLLVCKGRPPAVLRSAKEYSNYELTVEWRWPAGEKPGNSGVLIHCSKPREMHLWPKSIEVQLRSGDAGDFWTIGESLAVAGSAPEGRRWLKKGTGAEKPPGEWNTMRVRCHEATVSVWVNGTLVNEGVNLSATRGAICLQSENSEIHFKKVELVPIE